MRVRGSEHTPIPYDALLRAKRNPASAPRIPNDQRNLLILGGALTAAIVGLAAIQTHQTLAPTDNNSPNQAQAVGDPKPHGGFAELRYGDIRDEIVDFLTAPMRTTSHRDELIDIVKAKHFGFGNLELLEEGTIAAVVAREGLNNRSFPLDETITKAEPALDPGDTIEKPAALVRTSHTEPDGTNILIDWIVSRASDNSLRFNGRIETIKGNSRELASLIRPASTK